MNNPYKPPKPIEAEDEPPVSAQTSDDHLVIIPIALLAVLLWLLSFTAYASQTSP